MSIIYSANKGKVQSNEVVFRQVVILRKESKTQCIDKFQAQVKPIEAVL